MPLYYLNHCRDAIYLALKSLRLPKGSRVGLTVFNCQTVMAAVAAADCTPVFLDITTDYLLDVGDLKKKNTATPLQALIVTHLYGKINNISNIQSVIPPIPIIEDCAHAWNYFVTKIFNLQQMIPDSQSQSTYSHGQSPSSFYVTSTALGKCLNIGPGGLLLSNDLDRIHYLDKLYNKLNQVSCLQNLRLFFLLPLMRYAYASFLPKTSIWKSSRKFRHRHLNPWKNPLKMSPIVKRRLEKTNWQENFPLHVYPNYQNCLNWASQWGYISGFCPITEFLL